MKHIRRLLRTLKLVGVFLAITVVTIGLAWVATVLSWKAYIAIAATGLVAVAWWLSGEDNA